MHYIWTIGKVKTIDIGDTSNVIYDVEWTLTLWQNSDSTGKYALRSELSLYQQKIYQDSQNGLM